MERSGDIMQLIYPGSYSGAHTVDMLMGLARAEKDAVSAYRSAITAVGNHACRPELVGSMQSHQVRADLLACEVRRLGASPFLPAKVSNIDDETDLATCENKLAEVEELLNQKYAILSTDTDFAVQLLARRIQPQQAGTSVTINNLLGQIASQAA